jgi:hypothetical protein
MQRTINATMRNPNATACVLVALLAKQQRTITVTPCAVRVNLENLMIKVMGDVSTVLLALFNETRERHFVCRAFRVSTKTSLGKSNAKIAQ